MRISDWSSDVCSSDLINVLFRNWNAFKATGVSSVTSPYTFYGSMGLSAPRHFGGVKPSTSPSDPIIVSFGTGGNSGMLTNPVFVRGICGDDTPAIGTSNDEQYRARSEEHTSELQSLMRISYAVFCLKTQKNEPSHTNINIL